MVSRGRISILSFKVKAFFTISEDLKLLSLNVSNMYASSILNKKLLAMDV